jgi:hypothetical protein
MGLDLLEFVVTAEERFGIRIPEQPLADTKTLGEFVTLVIRLSEEQMATPPACRTSRAFFHMSLGTIAQGRKSRDLFNSRAPVGHDPATRRGIGT